MPEGDTVWRTALHLDRALSGSVLVETDFRVPDLATLDLSGQRVDSTVARGKHLLTRIGEQTLHTHLKMEGAWHLYKPATPWRRPAHEARVVLRTDDWTAVGFALGIVEVLPRADEETVVGHLGPDLLGPDWDEDEALRRLLADPARPVARGDPRPAQPRGHRQPLQERALLPRRRPPPMLPVGDVPDLRRLVRRARSALRGQQGTGRADPHRRHPPRSADLGLPPGATAVPTLRHHDPHGGAGTSDAGAGDVLVPDLPATGSAAQSGQVDVLVP